MSSARPGKRVAIVPAAGYGRRLGSPPQGKELIEVPLPGRKAGQGPVAGWLLDALTRTPVDSIIVVTRADKPTLAQMLGAPPAAHWPATVVSVASSPSVPHTVAAGLRSAGDADIAFGFPDMLFRPRDVFRQLFAALDDGSDAVLGLCAAAPGTPCDRVRTNASGEVMRVYPKPDALDELPTWISAVWRSEFSVHLHKWLAAARPTGADSLEMADLYNASLSSGLRVSGLQVPGYRFLDIGSPESLSRATDFASAPDTR